MTSNKIDASEIGNVGINSNDLELNLENNYIDNTDFERILKNLNKEC